ncbi:hypothetical protein CVT25_012399 [Psilocybe cyanescens]|uniref:Uncharacterized protein n=1 Tax=Psilocybe cyanescens TaxID=93625 RepID=A0A409X7R9_PSICY|nr:hypothetical protein CVT25_012399 [Psilocybe cyanescens]
MAPSTMLVDTEVGESPVPVHILRFNLRTFLTSSDNNTLLPLDPTIQKSRLHTLEPKPFKHLSVWAYLAFAFIVLAVTTVIAYAIYSCYHSSRKKMEAGMSLPAIPVGRDRVTWQDLGTSDTLVKTDHAAVGVGEKARLDSNSGSKHGLEIAGTGRQHKKMDSESNSNSFSLPSNSLSSMSNVNDTSLELDSHYLTSPPLAHTSDKAATYIPFHLPPPPPSPTPAHKEHLERQYRGHIQHSPVSPSPSFSPITSFPPITPKNAPVRAEGVSETSWSGKTITESNQFEKPIDQDLGEGAPVLQFDSNNIRFVPPCNPFMAPSNALRNDPKLSPIPGSIISKANRSGSSSTGDSSFSQAVMAASRFPPSISSRKRSKSVLGYDARHDGEDKENVDSSALDMSYGRNIP